VSPQVFRAALRDLGMTQVRAAEFLRVRPTTVNRWARGTRKIPGPVAAALDCARQVRALELWKAMSFTSATAQKLPR
jgi:DNA-binding transcriptional regulator YdaS (Cro superfamily)